MSEPTSRQVLYALVAAGFLLVVVALVVGGAVSGIVPGWWSVSMAVVVAVSGVWMSFRWRRTGPVLLVAIGLLVIWMVGTLAAAR